MDTMTLLLLCSPIIFFLLLQLLFSISLWRISDFDSPVYTEEPKRLRRHGEVYLDSSRPRYRKSPTY
jgi:hypothetical protein